MKKTIKNLGDTVIKNPFSSFLGIGALAFPIALDKGYLDTYVFSGPILDVVTMATTTLLIGNFLYKNNKNTWFKEKKEAERILNINSDEKRKKLYKPNIIGNAFLTLGAVGLLHSINHSFYVDFKMISGTPLDIYFNQFLTPTILLASTALVGSANLTANAVSSIREVFGKNFDKYKARTVQKRANEGKDSLESEDGIIQDISTTLDSIRKNKQKMQPNREMESEQTEEVLGKFKPLM